MLTTPVDKLHDYIRILRDDTGCTGYLFSPTPLRMERALFDQLNNAVTALMNTIDNEDYFHHCVKEGFWTLPVERLKKTDFTGCADFLLTATGAKLIEINLNLPGKVGLMQLLGETTVAQLDVSASKVTNLDYLGKIVDVIRESLPTEGKIALVVSHLINSSKHQPHYRYFAEQLCASGLEVEVVQACDIEPHEIGCQANGVVYSGMINLVIPFVWERNPENFRNWTKVLAQHPNLVFPHPTGGMLGTKDVLRFLDSQRHREEATNWDAFVLKAKMLSEFASVDALYNYLNPAEMVLKPLKDYDTKGVYVQPDTETIERLYFTRKDDYMVQQFTDSLAPSFQLPSGEVVQSHSVIYRVFFAKKQPIGYQAYFIHGAFNGDYYTAPVVVG